MDRSSDSRNRRTGFSLLEISVGMVFITIAILGLGAVFLTSQRGYEDSMAEALVTHTFRHMVEKIRAQVFSDIVTEYQGHKFTIEKLEATGTVTIFVNETRAPPPDAEALGLPRDLDGDGEATNTDVSLSYILLPIRLKVTWKDRHGRQTRSLYTYISKQG